MLILKKKTKAETTAKTTQNDQLLQVEAYTNQVRI